ncbi:MAG: 4-hydroxythreonine-4-phosphate dehydrogenase PdxA [Chitinophagaceae bacterium]
MSDTSKPIIGFTSGDLNGIGLELIIKSLSDTRILEHCAPVVFASNKSINFYRKVLPDVNFVYQSVKDFSRVNNKMVNVINCWEEEVQITPGVLNEIGGDYGRRSLVAAVDALKAGHIQGLVTAPVHKKNIYSDSFAYTGHTPYLKAAFEAKDIVMLMVASNMRVGLVTEHVPVAEIPKYITKEAILSKLRIMQDSIARDFGVDKPKLAVLGLNPHAGDEGLIGTEEEMIIKPLIKEAKEKNMQVFGPFSADAFFARGQYEKFDGVLAMYHDQGLIPFKSLALGEGVNFTAGISGIRTSPDHGTAFDIAGKGIADTASFLAAIFGCLDIIVQRDFYETNRANPLKKTNQRTIDAVAEKPVVLPD